MTADLPGHEGPSRPGSQRVARPSRCLLRPVLLLLLLPLSGCALFGPPSWVRRPPSDETHVYAVGSAGVTWDRNPARSREIARQRALDELARQIQVHVVSATRLRDSADSSFFQSRTLQFTEQDLEGIEVVEVWVDSRGKTGPPHQTWILLRIDRERAQRIAARNGRAG